MIRHNRIILLVVGVCFLTEAISGQKLTDTLPEQPKTKPWVPMVMSMVIPGSGQIYNKTYWKAPLIAGGVGGGLYATMHYQKLYGDFRSAYNSKLLAVENPSLYYDYYPDFTLQQLSDFRDRYQLYAKIGMSVTTAIYLVNVVDAYASAQTTRTPRAATLMSAILPGSGQIFNKKYWKAPIIYGGFATLYYFSEYNHKQFIKYRDMYNQKIASRTNPDIVDPAPQFSAEAIRLEREDWRRNRDLNYIGIALLYILNVIDANVDAHLIDYDVSDDLSMQFVPQYGIMGAQSTFSQRCFGASLSINF
ncbi:MAG TPA: DUF5683 domain-containing protein [Salinivirgaceae bacterium]|nr:DUF5683 domain-containing protein [Salinivirgaceae bacterium]